MYAVTLGRTVPSDLWDPELEARRLHESLGGDPQEQEFRLPVQPRHSARKRPCSPALRDVAESTKYAYLLTAYFVANI